MTTKVFRRVNLVKTDGVLGSLEVGTQIEFITTRDVPREDAVVRAYRQLKREHPDENTMCWTVDGESGGAS